MQIYLRLYELLRLEGKRARDIDKLAARMGLSRYKLELLAQNKWKAIKQDVLSKICDYLVEEGLADAADLPGILFGRAPSAFWQLLCEREQIMTCMGYRYDEFRDRVVIAADSQLQANLLYCMTQAAAHDRDRVNSRRARDRRPQRMPQIIDPWLVRTWDRKERVTDPEVVRETNDFYDRFVEREGDRALVCFGSVKSNPVIERVVAAAFPGHKAFHSQDDVAHAVDRACPFTFVYRDYDPKPNSLCGGNKLQADREAKEPGIHYAVMSGGREEWRIAPWTEKAFDAALVFYRFIRAANRFEIVLGGFSGRGTKFLAKLMRDRQEMADFWPPTIQAAGVDLGVFVVTFEEKVPSSPSPPQMVPEYKDNPKIIRLPKEVLERRLTA